MAETSYFGPGSGATGSFSTARLDLERIDGLAFRIAERRSTRRPADRYTIESELARGRNATVLLAHDRQTGQAVALKQPRRHPGADTRFWREATLTASLDHPSIVAVLDLGTWPDGTPYYAMPLIEGANLAAHLAAADDRAGRLALLPVVVAVCDAVAYAHSRGVVHRDIKPSNVLVDRSGAPVLIDWGVAVDLVAPAHREEASGLFVPTVDLIGTPGYLSPEQAAGLEVDERADVYALGAVLYHVITGKRPFAHLPSEAALAAVRTRAPAPIAEDGDVPAGLVAAVKRAMTRDPSARHRSAAELADELRGVMPAL